MNTSNKVIITFFALYCAVWSVDYLRFRPLYESVEIIARTSAWELLKLVIGYGVATSLTLGLLYLVATLRWIGPVLIGAAAALFLSAHFGFTELLRTHPTIADLNSLFHSSWATALMAVSSFSTVPVALFYVFSITIGLLLAFLSRRLPRPRLAVHIPALLLTLGANIGFWTFAASSQKMISVYPLEPLANSVRILSIAAGQEMYFNRFERSEVPGPSVAKEASDNIVLIIDESVRYDFVSLFNPDARTTPFLESLRDEGELTPMAPTIATGTASFSADMLLLIGTHTIPDREKTVLTNPTLFDFAKAHGYQTTLIDIPSTNFPSVFFRKKDLARIDKFMTGKDFGEDVPFPDMQAADYMRKLLSSSTGNFVVLIKAGAHFHYESTYPSDDAKYNRHLPKLSKDDSYSSPREMIVNSYKNAIGFNVDEFSRRLFQDALRATTVVYTSDHGQSLREDGSTTATHGGTALVEALVPTFIVSDHPWSRDEAWKMRMADTPLLSHHHIYPTLVALMSGDKAFHSGPFYSLYDDNFAMRPFTPFYFQGSILSTGNVFPVSYEQVRPYVSAPQFPVSLR